jgi:hypothetical protein
LQWHIGPGLHTMDAKVNAERSPLVEDQVQKSRVQAHVVLYVVQELLIVVDHHIVVVVDEIGYHIVVHMGVGIGLDQVVSELERVKSTADTVIIFVEVGILDTVHRDEIKAISGGLVQELIVYTRDERREMIRHIEGFVLSI